MDEELRLFVIDMVEFQASKRFRKSEELNPGITNEGFAESFEDTLMHLFYKFALIDEFHSLTENNQDKKNLFYLVTEYRLSWEAIFNEMEELNFDAGFLEVVPEKARYFINNYQLPRVSYREQHEDPEDMKYFGNEVESATKYLNFSLSLAIYAYYAHKYGYADLAWMCLLKAREMYAFFAAVRVFAFSSAEGRTSFKKTKTRSAESYNALIPLLVLELKNPPTHRGWYSLEDTITVLTERLITHTKRYKLFSANDTELKNQLSEIIRRWLSEDRLLKNIYDEFSFDSDSKKKLEKFKKYAGAKRQSFSEMTRHLLMEPFSPFRSVRPHQIFKKGDNVITLSAEEYNDLVKAKNDLKLCKLKLKKLEDKNFELLLK